jgi:hypothetical protein
LGGLPPGTYLLTLGANGYSTKTVEEMRISPDGQGPPDTAHALVEGTAGVEVTLVGPDGRPLANTPGVLGATGAADGRAYFGRSDSAGLLRFMPVVAGRYVLAVTIPGGAVRQKTTEIVVAEGQLTHTRLEFLPTFQVSGLATSGAAPYEGLLSFSKRGTAVAEQYSRTDGSGAFTIELEPGEYMVSRPGDARALQVEVRSGVSRLLELNFP